MSQGSATTGLRPRLKGIASRAVSRTMGALCLPVLPWLSRRESFRTLPERLLIRSNPAPADLIHILGGGQEDDHVRVDHGVELFRQGLAPRLLLTGSEFGIDWADRNARRALDMGVPRDALVLDPGPGTTRAEAALLRQIVLRDGVRSVLLVTEAFHAGRAARMMDRALRGTGAKLRSCPARASAFPPALWWESSRYRSLVLGEAVRLWLARALGNA